MKETFIPVSAPVIDPSDVAYVTKCLKDGWISGEGPYVEEFENAMARLCGREFGVAVSNGTIALDLALEVLDLQPGSEVILPSFTIISCLNHLLRLGLVPIFVDSDPVTWNMNVEDVEHAITDNTRAIIAVHIYGLPVDMDPLLELAEKYSLFVIEDAAESHGLMYKSKVCGSMGDLSTFSFYANKNITTGEGGMILTNDPRLANKLRKLRSLAFDEKRRFLNQELGWNARLGATACAMGTSQLKRLDDIIAKRVEVALRYSEAFSGIKGISTAPKSVAYAENNFWVYGIVLEENLGITASEAQLQLAAKGVGTRPFFYPLHEQPVLEKYGFAVQPALPISEKLGNFGFYIPNGLGIQNWEIDKVADSVIQLVESRSV